MKHPARLVNLREVVEYWRQCLELLDAGEDEQSVASRMVGVIASQQELKWSDGGDVHPAYQLIFELVASLELPAKITSQRNERWQCIRVLLPVLCSATRR